MATTRLWTESIEASAGKFLPRFDPNGPPVVATNLREFVYAWRQACSDLFDAEVAKVAAKQVEASLSGPYTHKYKGVAVTEAQFWQFMKLEGFERPAKEST